MLYSLCYIEVSETCWEGSMARFIRAIIIVEIKTKTTAGHYISLSSLQPSTSASRGVSSATLPPRMSDSVSN